jgi:multicomponent K+:H+ antiporter subunit F
MLDLTLRITLGLFAAAMLLNLLRLARGPDIVDRVLALDTLQVNAAAVLVLYGIVTRSPIYYEAALVIALFGFFGTVAVGRYLTRGRVIE